MARQLPQAVNHLSEPDGANRLPDELDLVKARAPTPLSLLSER